MRESRDIIIRPVVTEKSTNLMSGQNKYTFEVDPRARKHEVRRAVEEIFKVKVDGVNTISLKGKERRMGRFVGRKPDRKKAVVTLAPGDRIEIFEGV
ncbi:MAG: 50S ribosomal protein L23 [Firmicutes bacterium]|nr:50S ribosomal protein L23 [Bacillota bacterium]